MITFKQYLEEGKQVGVIYHFTNVPNAWIILSDKELLAKTESDFGFGGGGFTLARGREGVSFTRNPNLKAHKIAGGDGRAWGSVRIALDGNKLSNKYKIEPYVDKVNPSITRKLDQAEEIIKKKSVKIGGSIKQIDLLLSKEWADRASEYQEPDEDYESESIYGGVQYIKRDMTPDEIAFNRSDLAGFLRWVRKEKIKINIVKNFKKPAR